MLEKPVLHLSEVEDDVALLVAEVSDVRQGRRFSAACAILTKKIGAIIFLLKS